MKENISIRTMSLSKSLSQHEIQLRLTEHPQLVHKIVCCAVHGESQEQSAMSTVRQDVCTPGWVSACCSVSLSCAWERSWEPGTPFLQVSVWAEGSRRLLCFVHYSPCKERQARLLILMAVLYAWWNLEKFFRQAVLIAGKITFFKVHTLIFKRII